MKPTFVFFPLFLILTPLIFHGQDSHPLLDENAIWIQETLLSDGLNPDTTIFGEYQVTGDTIIDNLPFKKLFENGIFIGGLREENKRVIFHDLMSVDTILDFNLMVGDSFLVSDCIDFSDPECQYMILENIDSIILLDGAKRKRLNFQGYNAGLFGGQEFTVSWIDGIGSTRGMVVYENCTDLKREGLLQYPVCFTRLSCYQYKGELIFNNTGDFLSSCSVEGLINHVIELDGNKIQVSVFPNPAKCEKINIVMNNLPTGEKWCYKLIGQMGNTIFQSSKLSAPKATLHAADFLPGLYFLQTIVENKLVTEKLIIN